MKKIKNIMFVGLITMFMGCNDAIDITQPGRLDAANAFQSVDDLQAGLFGLFLNFNTTPEIALSANFCDEITIGAGSGGQGIALYNGTLNEGTAPGTDFWVRNFTANQRAVTLLEAAEVLEVDPSEQADFNAIIGQIHFIRAYANLQLLNTFSVNPRDDSSLGIPVIDFLPPLTIRPLRDTVGEGWDFIFSDLEIALSLTNEFSSSTVISRDAVRALMARAYTIRGNYPMAATIASDLLNRYPLSDRTEYVDMFLDDSDGEVIFKLERTANDPFDGQVNTGSVATGNGWAGSVFTFESILADPYFEIDRNVFNMLDPADVRFDVCVSPASRIDPDFETNPAFFGSDVLIPSKYPGSENQPLLNDLKVFRASEMLLILAEARAAQGDFGGAADLIQQLRTARFGSAQPLPTYNSMQQAFGGILDERRVEFLFEGQRYWDLKRLGVAGNRGVDRNLLDCNRVGAPCTYQADDFRFTLPIPLAEINANPDIAAQQNPGY